MPLEPNDVNHFHRARAARAVANALAKQLNLPNEQVAAIVSQQDKIREEQHTLTMILMEASEQALHGKNKTSRY